MTQARRVELAGFGIEASWTGALGEALLCELPPSALPPLLRLELGGSTVPAPSPTLDGLPWTCHFDVVDTYRSAQGWELWDGRSRASVSAQGVSLCLHPDSRPSIVAGALLPMALALALREHGAYHIHAACVSVPGLGGVLVPGPSGAGKSTLALAWCRQGAALVSDDTCFLRHEPAGVVAYPWPRELHVGQFAASALGLDLRQGRPLPSSPPKWAFPRARVPGGRLEASAPITALAFPRRAPAAAAAAPRAVPPTPLPPSDALVELLPPSALVGLDPPSTRAAQLQLLGHLASRAPSHRVQLEDGALPDPRRFPSWPK